MARPQATPELHRPLDLSFPAGFHAGAAVGAVGAAVATALWVTAKQGVPALRLGRLARHESPACHPRLVGRDCGYSREEAGS